MVCVHTFYDISYGVGIDRSTSYLRQKTMERGIGYRWLVASGFRFANDTTVQRFQRAILCTIFLNRHSASKILWAGKMFV